MAEIINLLGLSAFTSYLSDFLTQNGLRYDTEMKMIYRPRTDKRWWMLRLTDAQEIGRIECQNEKFGLITVHLLTLEFANELLKVANAYEKYNQNASVLVVVDDYDS